MKLSLLKGSNKTMISILSSIDLKVLILFTVPTFILKGFFLFFIFRIRRQLFLKWLIYGCLSFALGWFLFSLRFKYGMNLISLPIANILILLMPISLVFSILSLLKIRCSTLYLVAMFFGLGFTFFFLTWCMHERSLPGIYTSITNGILYFIPGFLLLKLAYPKQAIIWTMIGLNFLTSVVLIGRSFLLALGWFSPGFMTDSVITGLLMAALYLNVICVDAQVLCFPILDLIGVQKNLTLVNQKLETLSSTDELTGLLNRRALNTKLDLEISCCKRDNLPLSIILLDLDHFKKINDNFGHLVGDIVLEQISKLIKQLVRSTESVIRYGGEEFVVLLPKTDCSKALEIAERLRVSIAQFHFKHSDIPFSLQVTASFGVACLHADDLSMSELLKQADLALYKAKNEGRNRVCV
jgi:diguanylate cyclase (GGDEF)-like protein